MSALLRPPDYPPLTLCAVAFLARIYPMLEKEPGSTEPEADCGSSFAESSERSGPDGLSLKTSNTLGALGCPSCGAICGPSGTPACQFLCEPLTLAHRTTAQERLFLPTLSASSYGSNKGGGAGRVGPERLSLQSLARKGLLTKPGNGLQTVIGGSLSPTWLEWYQGLPEHWTERRGKKR